LTKLLSLQNTTTTSFPTIREWELLHMSDLSFTQHKNLTHIGCGRIISNDWD
jgi:hypothetical protein